MTDNSARIALALQYGARVAPNVIAQYLTGISTVSTPLFDHSQLHLGPKELAAADRILQRCSAMGIEALSITDSRYPKFLRDIPAAPPVLFVRGHLSVLEMLPGVAVVGSRSATTQGMEIARRISAFLSKKGWPIVSGLALGIDAAAHQGALEAGGKTIAVLAHGLHRASPAQNKALAEKILDSGGLWLSEHAPDVPAQKHFFVQRNRIQAGLSAGSIIVEGKAESGSMTQAQYCLGQKRQLFAILPPKGKSSLRLVSEGPEKLVKEHGAIAIRSLNDYELVLSALAASREALLRDP